MSTAAADDTTIHLEGERLQPARDQHDGRAHGQRPVRLGPLSSAWLNQAT